MIGFPTSTTTECDLQKAKKEPMVVSDTDSHCRDQATATPREKCINDSSPTQKP